jgi:integrase
VRSLSSLLTGTSKYAAARRLVIRGDACSPSSPRSRSATAPAIAGALSTLSLVMRKAKKAGLIPANPVQDLERDERPSVGGDEKRILDEAEITRLLRVGDSFRVLLATMIFSGVRIGEALGLTWSDVDFDRGFVRVRYQLDRKRTRVPVKTDAGRRDIVLVPQLAKLLREHRVASPHSRDVDYVFPSPDGRGRDHRSTSRGVERAVARAKLGDGISSHNLRHTFASMLIVGLRLDPVRVAKQLGHTKPSFTEDTYAHLFEQARHADELRDSLDKGFGHLLEMSTAVSTSARNEAQPEPSKEAVVTALRG